MTIPQALLLGEYRPIIVTPGSSTFDTGSGNFTVPNYNTLTVELWGGGGSGESTDGSTFSFGGSGSNTTCTTLSMTAQGGALGQNAGGGGGPASGGNTTNTTGNSGGGRTTSGTGGGAASGGGNVSPPGANGAGTAGSTPGGGGSGARLSSVGGGAGGGGYSKSVYTRGVTSGAPAIGASLAYAVGAGAAPNIVPGLNNGGAGTNGRVKFTWS